jgi:hypothetical protein
MTRTEERLTDALGAAARALREDTLHPLQVPERGRHRLAWIAPVAAAASVFLVVGLGVALAGHLPGSGPANGSPGVVMAPNRYYIEGNLDGGRPVVRSTATGSVTATVPAPQPASAPGYEIVASARNGLFFMVAFAPALRGQRIYRFHVTGSGRVSGFSPVPGGVLGGGEWAAHAIAASPDGSQVAVSFSFLGSTGYCGGAGLPSCASANVHQDYIDVINVATGAKSVWRGGLTEPASSLSIANLSWTGDGRELVFLGQWCGPGGNAETCGGKWQVWALDPASGGGQLDSGRILLRQSARYREIAQALISPDGSTITAVVLTGPVVGNADISGSVPANLSVDQISAATGRLLRVLYRRDLGDTSGVNGVPDPLALMPDATGQHWMLNGGICSGHCDTGFNGWIDHGQLVPLQPTDGRLAAEAW